MTPPPAGEDPPGGAARGRLRRRGASGRADVDGFDLRTQVADAQALPFAEGEFDVVMSTIGAMFAADQQAVGREMLRVCRPGGRIGMANWTPDSMVGDMFRIVGSPVPPPQGVKPAVTWGSEEVVSERADGGRFRGRRRRGQARARGRADRALRVAQRRRRRDARDGQSYLEVVGIRA